MSARDPDQTYQTMPQMMRGFAEQFAKTIHTAIPAVVVSYDPTTAPPRARVRPAVDLLFTDGTTMPRAELLDVPVLWHSTSEWAVTMPLAAGDTVLVVFCERDISGFKHDRTARRLPSNRIMSEADAVAIPGFGPAVPITPASTDGVTIQNVDGSTALVIEDGHITFTADTVTAQTADGATSFVMEAGRITLNADTVTINYDGGTQTWP